MKVEKSVSMHLHAIERPCKQQAVIDIKSHNASHLYELIPPLQRSHQYPGCFQTFCCRTKFFQNSFWPFTITEWNKLDSDIKNIDSHAMFRKKLLAFIRPLGNDTYGIYDPLGIRSPNRFR